MLYVEYVLKETNTKSFGSKQKQRFTLALLLRILAGGFSSFCGPEPCWQDCCPLLGKENYYSCLQRCAQARTLIFLCGPCSGVAVSIISG